MSIKEKECVWNPKAWDDGNSWATECGHELDIGEEIPMENNYNYCPKCGREINVVVVVACG